MGMHVATRIVEDVFQSPFASNKVGVDLIVEQTGGKVTVEKGITTFGGEGHSRRVKDMEEKYQVGPIKSREIESHNQRGRAENYKSREGNRGGAKKHKQTWKEVTVAKNQQQQAPTNTSGRHSS